MSRVLDPDGSGADAAQPKISVIIPTFNRALYIRQAIDSVLNQTCDNFEIIVVDDGSTDDTAQIVANYGGRVQYVKTPNGGVAHARNVGMCQARGDYFTFLDSDDLVYPYMLEVQSKLLDRHPDVALVYAEMSGFDDAGYFDKYHLKTYHSSAYRSGSLSYERLFETSATLGDLGVLPAALVREEPVLQQRRGYFGEIFDVYLTNLLICQNNLLVRRSVISSVGPRNERIRYWEEVDYLLRISRSRRVCFLDLPTYKLRYHAGQISTTAGKDGRTVWLRKQQSLLRVVKRHALLDPTYYERHRRRIDRHLAHLHRAVAIPLMVCEGRITKGRDYAARARRYLARCARYGHSHWTLWALTFAPGPVRRFAVSALETARGTMYAIRRRVTSRFAGSSHLASS